MIKKSDLKLISPDDPVLLTPPKEWDFNDSSLDGNMFANILFDRLEELGGVGLSANQVGVSYRVFVMGMNEYKEAIFNPSIEEISKEIVSGEEGCLSFPGIYLNLARPSWIKVKYFNPDGKEIKNEFTGLTARIFLHEFDHMQGITFKDRASKLKWDLASKRKDKRTKKIIRTHVQKQILQQLTN